VGASLGEVPQLSGPPLRFGITPSGAAGQIGSTSSEFAPDRLPDILAAMRRLRSPGRPFVAHIYSSWSAAGPGEDRRLRELVETYTADGFLAELVLRYKPAPERDGDVSGFVDWVRHMVRLFGPNPRVLGFQVTNEVNITFSGDSSDGAFKDAREALIEGIVAGDDEARKRGHGHVEVGFNWFYRTDPGNERSFWEHLRDRGGPRFLSALDWVGVDVYPGTYFPPETSPGQERNVIVDALTLARNCYMPVAGIPARVPIHIQENGYPTGPGRSEERQLQMLESMVRTFHDFRGTFNVTDYRWFNMRDADTASPNFQQHFGMMESDYRPKPAFPRYGELVAELAGPVLPVRGARLRVGYARGRTPGGARCARRRVRAELTADDPAARIESVEFRRGGRRAARDVRPPFAKNVLLRRSPRSRSERIAAVARLRGGETVAVPARRVRACPASAG
jgi:hypothetical protein